MNEKKALQLMDKVNADYSKISGDFSQTRQYLWKEFEFFKPYIGQKIRVADIGCGNGRLKKLFVSYPDIDYIGIEKNTDLLKKAQEQFGKKFFKQGDILNIPLENNSCDIVFCIAVLHHIPSPFLEKAIDELYRILKPNGILIVTVWNLWQKKYRKHVFEAIKRHIFGKSRYGMLDAFIPWKNEEKRYYHAFLPSHIRKKLKKFFTIRDSFYTADGQKTRWTSSHNFCFVCQKTE